MLKIIMGSENIGKEVNGVKFIRHPNTYFNEMKEKEWFHDKFVKQIIKEIDTAYVESDFAVHSINYDQGYSVNDLSGGAKFLILAYKLRNRVYLATMGDNCTDLLEQIALDYEKNGEDLVIVTNYLHKFNFKYIDKIEYLNWGIICKSKKDISSMILNKWYTQETENR